MPNSLSLSIDGVEIQAMEGTTILKAAQDNNIAIPTLCHYPNLSPFGGCRLCLVEIEGLNQYATACTTPVSNGMKIHANTESILSLRREILKLILSEHPSHCLLCTESGDCSVYMSTIRKGEVITGCRSCSKDTQCDLQNLVKQVGLESMDLPVHYRGLPVEKYDPFFDRDFNLCVLCGRCVRVCQEIRLAETLTFKLRGHHTVVGPAFDHSYIDASCEFCGACVDVCPTGSLLEKMSKWNDKPDAETSTTCPYCGLGCEIKIHTRRQSIIGSKPGENPHINNGQLCVYGRFCVTEVNNSLQRLKRPYQMHNNTRIFKTMDEIISIAAQRLSLYQPDQFQMLVSPNLTNEDLYIAQKFTRQVMQSESIHTIIRSIGAGNLSTFNLFKDAAQIQHIKDAPVILCVGIDLRFQGSIIGVELKKAIQNGALILSIHPHPHHLTRIATRWLKVEPGVITAVLSSLADAIQHLKIGKETSPLTPLHFMERGGTLLLQAEIEEFARLLVSAQQKTTAKPIILVGPEYVQDPGAGAGSFEKYLLEIQQMAQLIQAKTLFTGIENNLLGSFLMGCHEGLLPGGNDQHERIIHENHPQVVYMIGESGSNSPIQADFTIFQNAFSPPDSLSPDLVIPSALLTEIDGTTISAERRIRRVTQAAPPPGEALPNWKILCQIAQKMGKSGFDFANTREIQEEISRAVPGIIQTSEPGETIEQFVDLPIIVEGTGTDLNPDHWNNPGTPLNTITYQGFPLSTFVEGLNDLPCSES